MKRIKYLLFSIFLTFTVQLFGQNYRVIDVDVTNFPMVKAHLLALNPQYKTGDLLPDNVLITEDNRPILPVEFKAPKASVLPTSIVLVLDVSASMAGVKFEMLKKTAKAFIAKMPLEVSEVAIASFNNEIILQCDFTHNITRLNQTVDRLATEGGTDFDRAFLTPFSGALSVARMGNYRKVVVLLTDGMSKLKPYEVANIANFDSTVVNCVTIDLPITDELKTITRETGGRYYSNLISEKELDRAYEKIYADIQVNTYGTIVWKSNYSCQPLKTALIKLNSDTIPVTFSIPNHKIGSLEATPTALIFPKSQPNQTVFQPVIVKGNQMDLIINTVTSSNPSHFGIQSQSFPIIANANESMVLQLSYTATDTLFAIGQFTVSQKGCPDVIIDASTMGSKKLDILTPEGKEQYARGAEIPVTWKGVDKPLPVDFFYRAKVSNTWVPILTGKNYETTWQAPAIDDSIRILGRITNNVSLANLFYAPVAFIDDAPLKWAIFNAEGTEVLTLNENGILKNWDASAGLINHTFENNHGDNVMFFPDNNRVISYTPVGYDIYTNRNGLLIKRMVENNAKVKASLTHFHDREFYCSLGNYVQLHPFSPKIEKGDYINATKAIFGNYYVSANETQLQVYENNTFKKWFAIRLDAGFEQAIISNNDFMVIDYNKYLQLYNLKTKQLVAKTDKKFLQFTASGNHFLAQKGSKISVYEVQSGDSVTGYPKNSLATFSKSGKYLAYSNTDSLFVRMLGESSAGYGLPLSNIEQMQFYPKSAKLAILTDTYLKVLLVKTGVFESETPVESSIVKSMDISPIEESILFTTLQVAALWTPNAFLDTDTTNYFKVFTPKPMVVSQLNFGNVFIESTKEELFTGVILNNTSELIIIDSVYLKNGNSGFEQVAQNKKLLLQPNTETAVELRFTPKQKGIHQDTLIVISGKHTDYCKVTGMGILRDFALSTAMVDFGKIKVFQISDTVIPILVNTGTEPLTFEKLTVAGTETFFLTQINKGKVLNASDTLWVKVQFRPAWHGRFSSYISITLAGQKPMVTTELYGQAWSKREAVIAGVTLNRQTGKPMVSQIFWNELQSAFVMGTAVSTAEGNFAFTVKTDLNYSITADATGFYASSENIDLTLPQFADTLFTTIWLSPVIHNAQVQLNNIFFEVDKAELLDLSKPELNRLGQFLLTERNLDIVIIGHTDSNGDNAYNMELSKQRAGSVKAYLEAMGVKGARIQMQYFGEEKPMVDNCTEAGRKANRRVEIRFITEPE